MIRETVEAYFDYWKERIPLEYVVEATMNELIAESATGIGFEIGCVEGTFCDHSWVVTLTSSGVSIKEGK